MRYQLRISGIHSKKIFAHLFPGDGKEAVCIAICGHHIQLEHITLIVHEIFPIPYDECSRSEDYVSWKTDSIIPYIEKASKLELSILKIHSHPTGYQRFSELDDKSDSKLFPSLYGWIDGDQPHGSIVALPNETYFGRIFTTTGDFEKIEKISIVGDTINVFNTDEAKINEEASLRNIQTFGLGTTKLLKKMKIGVIGTSGTGSPTIEQLARLGVGALVLVDPDKVEQKNLNRILNTWKEHANKECYKVDVLSKAIEKMGFDTNVITYKCNLFESREAIRELISCDVLFGCVDSIDGRHLLNQIATFYCIPYFDLGIKLEANGNGGIKQINGVVHYIQPGGSSLMTRGVYNTNTLEAASLLRQNPEEFEKRLKEKYIVNVPVNSPAVISINMQISSFAINEFLDRIHSFKGTHPSERSINWISITEGLIFSEPDGEPDRYLEKKIGRGDCKPLLEMSEI